MTRHFKRILGVTPKQYQLARGTNQEDPGLVERADFRVH